MCDNLLSSNSFPCSDFSNSHLPRSDSASQKLHHLANTHLVLSNVGVEKAFASRGRSPDGICDPKAMRHALTDVGPSSLCDVISTCPAINKPFGAKDDFYASLKTLPSKVNVFFGVGLGTPKGMSKGLPLDLLNMLFLVEGIGAQKYIVIADETAKNNIHHCPESFSEEGINLYADTVETQLKSIISTLGFKGWHCIRESSLPSQEGMDLILNTISLPEHLEKEITQSKRDPLYFRQQYAHMAFFEKQENCAVKVGWCFGEKGASEQFSEAGFDEGFNSLASHQDYGKLQFVYTNAGRSFDKCASRASPYVCLDDSKRIMLTDNGSELHAKMTQFESIRSTAKKKTKVVCHTFEKQGQSVVDMFNWLVDQGKVNTNKIEEGSFENKIGALMSHISH